LEIERSKLEVVKLEIGRSKLEIVIWKLEASIDAEDDRRLPLHVKKIGSWKL